MAGWNGTRLRHAWRIAFVAGVLLINYPFLHLFNRKASLFGFPLLFVYFFVGWAISIGVIALYVWALGRAAEDPEE